MFTSYQKYYLNNDVFIDAVCMFRQEKKRTKTVKEQLVTSNHRAANLGGFFWQPRGELFGFVVNA